MSDILPAFTLRAGHSVSRAPGAEDVKNRESLRNRLTFDSAINLGVGYVMRLYCAELRLEAIWSRLN